MFKNVLVKYLISTSIAVGKCMQCSLASALLAASFFFDLFAHCKKNIGCFNCRVVTMVGWLALVLEANYIRKTVSLFFPPLSNSEYRKRRGNNKETTSLHVLYSF